MRRKQIKKLPKEIYFMKISRLLGFALGLFLIIASSAKSRERE
jgi:hypothetical protein